MGMTTKGQAEINVTPLIDVLLVLLIIFIVMIPVMSRMQTIDIPPKLPDDSTVEQLPIVVKVSGDLSMQIDDAPPFIAGDLAGQLRSRLPTHKVVFLDVDDGVPWSEVLGTVDSIRGVAGSLDLEVQVAVRVREAVGP
jgi:biopolymer transport protein TolR